MSRLTKGLTINQFRQLAGSPLQTQTNRGVFVVKITLPQPGDLIRDLTVESEDVQVLGSIPEGGNTHVNARRIELPEGFNSGGWSYINLVALLTYLIKHDGREVGGRQVGYFRVRVRNDIPKLEIDVDRVLLEDW